MESRVSKLPKFIKRLLEIHESQVLEIRGALHGRGNFELSERAKHIRESHNIWITMTDVQGNKIYSKFTHFRPRSDFQDSSDGRLTIPVTPTLAKKPGHVKRVRGAKTTTIGMRPRVD